MERGQGRNLEAGTEVEVMEECCLLQIVQPALFYFYYFIFLFLETGFLCIFGCSGTHSVDQIGLRLTEIHLSLPPECWG